MDTWTLRQPRERPNRSAGQGRGKPGQITSLPPFAGKDEGAYSRQHPRREWDSSTKGGHLRKVDSTLPAAYTRKLYGNLPRGRAYLLTQLRTGYNWLSTYAKAFGFRDNDQCVYGAQETVTHVLVDCPNMRELRRNFRSETGDAFSSVSSLLGGSTEGERGKPDTVSRARTVKAVLDFAEASQRFQSRAP
ncbi:uncharacterized protein N7525_004672 [Penicillium rubens]|uniref:uncharacterized protein n=1 Tax=Penicillium rubens TaxID=1108849 RepID=UPI002A5A463A|nr:uncharacterized protein N7525_004672 [Penicillium rubens]KAJ5839484.1 hypothetical protein N7525_004672 [Penicillium rubens]